ncbi:MAG: transcription antitermination factor NusB [Candidatus Marinimicrobia bacterium]|nr:transcription antitermination factor NusB [Candidatus Neomarinimicrobiota bacterium]
MKERRQAREEVLKSLYAKEMTGYNIAAIEDTIIDKSELTSELKIFGKNLFKQTVTHQDKIDEHIKRKSENWDFSRIALIDKIILRMAICEFFYLDDVPPKVSIAEAIEIAKKFSTDDSSSFVNGILDAVFHSNENKVK